MRLGGIFDYDSKKERLTEVELELAEPDVWNDQCRAQELGRERSSLEQVVKTIDDLDQGVSDTRELLDMIVEEGDESALGDVEQDIDRLNGHLSKLEFRRMFAGETDPNNAYLDIQSGSGGTEAQDWAEMVLRMYLRWGDDKGFKTSLEEASAGDVAGIKSATIRFEGEYAFGWLRTETGVHRLVRKSPFDSGNRRHTSFCSVFVSPEIDDDFVI
jgi:peptide chain release factor 2